MLEQMITALKNAGVGTAKVLYKFKPTRWLMETAITTLIKNMPGLLVVWVYPWIAQPLLLPYVGGLPNATFICQKLVDSFTNPPATISPTTTVPEEAFALTIQELLVMQGLNLSVTDIAPLLVSIGNKGLTDPTLAEPTA